MPRLILLFQTVQHWGLDIQSVLRLSFLFGVSILALSTGGQAMAGKKTQNKDALSQCYDEIGDKPRTALESCLDQMEKQARHALGQQLGKTRKDIIDTGSSAGDAALKSLEASEKAFEAFLKAECQRVTDAAMGGSGAGDFGQGCTVDLLRWRTAQLQQQ